MFKNILTVFAVLFFINVVKAQDAFDLIQPDRSLTVDSSHFHSNIDTLKKSTLKINARGLMIRCGVTAGDYVVWIHLINDAAGVFVPYPVASCEPTPVLFDMIQSTGTTVNLDSIIVFPVIYPK